MPNGPLDRDSFNLWAEEHQKYLDARFAKVCASIAAIVETHDKNSDDSKDFRKVCRNEVDEKFKNTHKYIVIGLAAVAILAGAQIPAVQAAAIAIIKLIF